ncbi:MAG: hypothetical protein Q4Q06_00590 [Bacteroidota bacterium]|nr:hypothetical protein [Bacteroidota bacterium]
MKKYLNLILSFLKKLSFCTGVIILLMCILFYILSFVQLTFDLDIKFKGVLWVVLFGLAKTFQYLGLTIIGAEGVRKLKTMLSAKKT